MYLYYPDAVQATNKSNVSISRHIATTFYVMLQQHERHRNIPQKQISLYPALLNLLPVLRVSSKYPIRAWSPDRTSNYRIYGSTQDRQDLFADKCCHKYVSCDSGYIQINRVLILDF